MITELRSVHPVESKEITPFGAWIFSRVLIGMSALMVIPVAMVLLWQT